jgi:hypothetical protein
MEVQNIAKLKEVKPDKRDSGDMNEYPTYNIAMDNELIILTCTKCTYKHRVF